MLAGRAKVRTGGCEASPLLYNLSIKQVYRGEASVERMCRLLTSSRPTLPPRARLRSVGLSVPTQKRSPARGYHPNGMLACSRFLSSLSLEA